MIKYDYQLGLMDGSMSESHLDALCQDAYERGVATADKRVQLIADTVDRWQVRATKSEADAARLAEALQKAASLMNALSSVMNTGKEVSMHLWNETAAIILDSLAAHYEDGTNNKETKR